MKKIMGFFGFLIGLATLFGLISSFGGQRAGGMVFIGARELMMLLPIFILIATSVLSIVTRQSRMMWILYTAGAGFGLMSGYGMNSLYYFVAILIGVICIFVPLEETK